MSNGHLTTDPDLARVAAAWPRLDEEARAVILALAAGNDATPRERTGDRYPVEGHELADVEVAILTNDARQAASDLSESSHFTVCEAVDASGRCVRVYREAPECEAGARAAPCAGAVGDAIDDRDHASANLAAALCAHAHAAEAAREAEAQRSAVAVMKSAAVDARIGVETSAREYADADRRCWQAMRAEGERVAAMSLEEAPEHRSGHNNA